MTVTNGQVIYFGQAGAAPRLEILNAGGHIRSTLFNRMGAGRHTDEACWQANPDLPASGRPWRFRVKLGGGNYDTPPGHDAYATPLTRLWLQDGQLFAYRPAAAVSPSQVIKVPRFKGRLSPRPLYIYLPRGYAEHTDRRYPVLYMHDGQNCFETFVADSFSGSWRADQTADWLISQGRMRECIIVGVSNGGRKRNTEYLPPYAAYRPPRKQRSEVKTVMPGAADQTLAYYRDDIAPFIQQEYRTLTGREQVATCGSSLGGLFSTYIAWEHPEFARHHAVLSPAFWITDTAPGRLEAIERLRSGPPPDVRLWLDSGTRDAPGRGDDDMHNTQAARRALLENRFEEGPDFHYHLAKGAIHHESAWAARLHLVLKFLFPPLQAG